MIMAFRMCRLRLGWSGAIVAIMAVVLLAGCENTQEDSGIGPKTAIGGLGGAAAGGLLGAALGGHGAGIAAGALIGGLVGGAVGNVMDENDKRYANQAAQQALEKAPSGTATAWKNPDSGHS